MEAKRVWVVLCAADGSTVECHLPNEASVEDLQRKLAEVSGVAVQRQVLINESGINVRPGMHLTSPRHESPIFLFDMHAITGAHFQLRSFSEPPLLSEQDSAAKPADASQDTVEKAVQVYQSLQSRAGQLHAMATKCHTEQQIMARALLSARCNLMGHATFFAKKFQAFNKELHSSFTQYDKILASCDSSFCDLQKVPLPPELTTQGEPLGASMSQSASIQNIQSIRSYVAGALQQLKGRFAELNSTNMECNARLNIEMDMAALEPGISASSSSGSAKGSHFIKLDDQASEIIALQAAQTAAEVSADGSGDHLGPMFTTDAKLVAATRAVFAAHTTLQQEVHARMQHICKFQSQIQKMARSISGYRDSLQSLEQYFAELEHVPFISAAFKAGLTEVRRRREFRDAYANKARECTDSIKQLVQCEVGVRKAFAKTHGQHLPPTLIPGLAELPPEPIDIEIPGFDMELPSLESLEILDPAFVGSAEDLSDREFEPDNEEAQSEFYSPRKKPLEASVSPKLDAEDGAASEVIASSETKDELKDLRQALETVRQERDIMKQSMLEAEWKLSNHEALAKSMDEVRMNNTNLEVQLSEAKTSLGQVMSALDARSSTLNEVRQIVGLAGSMQSGVGSSSTASSMSESMDDAALLEALKAQKAASDEADRVMHENCELNKQLQQRGPVTQESSRHNLAFSSFAPHDWMCFQLCSSCTNGESDESPPHVYEAISDEGDTRGWFLPPSQPELGVQPARLVIGQMVEAEAFVAEGSDNVFGLAAGSSYHCVTLTEEKKFA